MPDGTNIANVYDADGKRVQQAIGSQTTNYLWDELSPYGDVVLETNNSGGILASYVLAGTELISQKRGGTTSYYLHDGQESVNALTNASANVTDTYSYSAFGETLNHTGSTVNSYQYTGQQLNSQMGLYDLRTRYYDPAIGRFLSRDIYPSAIGDSAQLNRYVYSANNPVNWIDPLGLQAFVEYTSLQEQNEAKASAAEGEVYSSEGDALLKDDIVYRGLAEGENPVEGLFARSPSANNSPISHVAGKGASQWISTTRNSNIAINRFGTNGVVKIDLSKVSSTIVDFSRGIPGNEGTMLSNWAKVMQEVLVQGYIPPEAIIGFIQ